MARPRRDGQPPRKPNRRNLTEKFVERLRPDERRHFLVWDERVRGLILIVYPTGAKVWRVIYSQSGRSRWYTIGRYPPSSWTMRDGWHQRSSSGSHRLRPSGGANGAARCHHLRGTRRPLPRAACEASEQGMEEAGQAGPQAPHTCLGEAEGRQHHAPTLARMELMTVDQLTGVRRNKLLLHGSRSAAMKSWRRQDWLPG